MRLKTKWNHLIICIYVTLLTADLVVDAGWLEFLIQTDEFPAGAPAKRVCILFLVGVNFNFIFLMQITTNILHIHTLSYNDIYDDCFQWNCSNIIDSALRN